MPVKFLVTTSTSTAHHSCSAEGRRCQRCQARSAHDVAMICSTFVLLSSRSTTRPTFQSGMAAAYGEIIGELVETQVTSSTSTSTSPTSAGVSITTDVCSTRATGAGAATSTPSIGSAFSISLTTFALTVFFVSTGTVDVISAFSSSQSALLSSTRFARTLLTATFFSCLSKFRAPFARPFSCRSRCCRVSCLAFFFLTMPAFWALCSHGL